MEKNELKLCRFSKSSNEYSSKSRLSCISSVSISMEDLAEKIGVNPATIWRFENHKFNPNFDMVLDIMRNLELFFFVSEKEDTDDEWSVWMNNRWGQNDNLN